mmetsp:Transcript_70418/g.155305  ORF Transcript_70418/g.155305 Transcript_70418/m.155305 type:complete len:269 (-) Transcript_70418:22-828(-)
MKVTPCTDPGPNFKGQTLVLPGAGGIANLGELSADALIATYGLQRVAIVENKHLLPVAMVNAFSAESPAVTTAAEIYQAPCGSSSLTVLQLRSGAVEGRRWAFAKELLRWAKDVGVATVLVLASCSAHVKGDADLSEASPLRGLAAGGRLPELLPLGHGLSDAELADGPGTASAARHLLRGSGLARPLLEVAAEPGSPSFAPPSRVAPSVCCICSFTNETLDWRLPMQLVDAAADYLSLPKNPLVRPPSWLLAQQAQMAPPPENLQLW